MPERPTPTEEEILAAHSDANEFNSGLKNKDYSVQDLQDQLKAKTTPAEFMEQMKKEGDGVESESSAELEKARMEFLEFAIKHFDQLNKWLALRYSAGAFVERFKIAPELRPDTSDEKVDQLVSIEEKPFDCSTRYGPILLGLIIMSLTQDQIATIQQEIQEVNAGQKEIKSWEATEEIEKIDPLRDKSIVEIGGSELQDISRGAHFRFEDSLTSENHPFFETNTTALNGHHVPLFSRTDIVTIAGGEYANFGGEKGSPDFIRTNNYQSFVGDKKFDFCATRGVFTGGSGIENTAGNYGDSVRELLATMSLILKDGGYSLHIGDDEFDPELLKKLGIEKMLEVAEVPIDWDSDEVNLQLAMTPYNGLIVLKHRSPETNK